jgi:hypothetical protein
LKKTLLLWKASTSFENVYKKPRNLSKCLTLMKKASIYLEIILKSLKFSEIASIPLKISSKSVKTLRFLIVY